MVAGGNRCKLPGGTLRSAVFVSSQEKVQARFWLARAAVGAAHPLVLLLQKVKLSCCGRDLARDFYKSLGFHFGITSVPNKGFPSKSGLDSQFYLVFGNDRFLQLFSIAFASGVPCILLSPGTNSSQNLQASRNGPG